MRRTGRPTGKTTLEIALEGKAGDALAAYVAEGLIGSDFEPSGETESDIRSSIEARAYVNWMKIEKAKRATFLLSTEDTRNVFLKRFHPGAFREDQLIAEDDARMVRFDAAWREYKKQEGLTRAGSVIPRHLIPKGDAYEDPEPVAATG